MTTVQNFIGGELVDSVSGAKMSLVDPSTGEHYGTAPISNAAGRRQRVRGGRHGVQGLEAHDAVACGRRRCSTSPTRSRSAPTTWWPPRAATRASRSRDHGGGDPADGRPDPVLRRRRPRAGGQVGRRVHGGPHVVDPPRAGRRRRAGRAVELPDDDGDLEVRPAVAAGNTVVLKPSDTTPVTTVMLAELAAKHSPPGVLNVVTGDRVTGASVVAHPTPQMVSITGRSRRAAPSRSARAGTSSARTSNSAARRR